MLILLVSIYVLPFFFNHIEEEEEVKDCIY